uniref:Uncharacterized protein n=1 Tax=Fig badnavirus 1 TaxID=1034096 RepID=A0A517B6Y7_9VIRU|nr:hypothetical protein [Fig badnavirus 1]WVH32575.1 hypothetical protein [Fig badnavirus 1]WVH32579.1 hypothetical protein [Fig badnavirus 1]WVH32583.1 hypothetical protein [Fig badnavirus 1]WVH32587.1 hypothetical protein [Fig badnavirus 1]
MESEKGGSSSRAREAYGRQTMQEATPTINQQNDGLFQQYQNLAEERERILRSGGISFARDNEFRKQLREVEEESARRAIEALEQYRQIHTLKTAQCASWSSPGRDGNYWSDCLPSVRRYDARLEKVLQDLKDASADSLKFRI